MAEAGLEKLGLETPSPKCAQGSLLPITQGMVAQIHQTSCQALKSPLPSCLDPQIRLRFRLIENSAPAFMRVLFIQSLDIWEILS